jgi:hypothetical protein
MQILRERKILKLKEMTDSKDNTPIDGYSKTDIWKVIFLINDAMLHKSGDNWSLDKKYEIVKIIDSIKPQTYTPIEADEPYFGWCDVEGCENEGCSGGIAWEDSGYWTVCHKHSDEYRKGLPQPKMKQTSIDRENSRGEDGRLPLKPKKLKTMTENKQPPIDGLLDTLRSIANNYPEWNPHKEKYDCQIDAQGAIDKFHKAQPQTSTPIEAKPKVVCYCGSLRVALEAFKKAEYESVLSGEIALLPCCMFVDIQREYGAQSDYKVKADDLHKRKIDICDEVFVLNVGGYIGESTRSEIDYANKVGKPVKYLEP